MCVHIHFTYLSEYEEDHKRKIYEIQKLPNIDNIVNSSSKPVVSILVPET
jgi:hypothetical protein